jgi:hypothetical protein
LIGGGGVAEMWRMVEFHTDLTAGFARSQAVHLPMAIFGFASGSVSLRFTQNDRS